MEYVRPQNMKQALQMMERWKRRAEVVAGGTNVIPDLRARAIQPEVLIDLSRLKNLSYIKEEKERIRIGALTTLSAIASSETVRRFASVLSEATGQMGNPLVRNRATIGGNLADASPAADGAPPLLVLDASMILETAGGASRTVPIDQFFLGPNRTVLKEDELIREVVFPKAGPSARMAYSKFGLRNAMAISVVSIAVLLEIEEGICRKGRIALGAVSPTPIRAHGVEGLLMNQALSEELISRCCEKVQGEIQPISDIRASEAYRRSVASVLLGRLLRQVMK